MHGQHVQSWLCFQHPWHPFLCAALRSQGCPVRQGGVTAARSGLSSAATLRQVGGKWLGWWIVAAAAVSQIGQFEAEMSSDAFQLLGMAERGFLPAALAKRSRHDTPTLAICCSSIGILMLVCFDFVQVSWGI